MASSKTIDVYSQLPFAPKDTVNATPGDAKAYVVSKLTQSSDPGSTYDARVRGKHILLENPVKDSRTRREREEKKARRKRENEKRKRKKFLGREATMFKLEPSQCK